MKLSYSKLFALIAVLVFVTIPNTSEAAYTVTTKPATDIGLQKATLVGEVGQGTGTGPFRAAFYMWLKGLSQDEAFGSGAALGPITSAQTNLRCGKTYQYKLFISQGSITNPTITSGNIVEFSTLPCDGGQNYTIVANPVNSTRTRTEATISGYTLGPIPYTAWFEMKGESGEFSKVEGDEKAGTSRTTTLEISTRKTGLECGKNYQFRVYVKAGTGGTSQSYYSSPMSFSTVSCAEPPPVVDVPPASTAGNCEYTLLVPSLPFGKNGVVNICAQGGVLALVEGIFNIFLILAIVLAVILLIYGGAKYATSDAAGTLGEGKKIITNALQGLAFALFTWLLLNTLNTEIVKVALVIPTLLPSVTSDVVNNTPGNTTPGGGTGTITPPMTGSNQERFARIAANEADVRGQLERGHVTVTGTAQQPPCTRYGQSGCTMVGLVGSSAIEGLIALKQVCNCTVTVTAGTEWWAHGPRTTHVENGNTVDINYDNTLNTFIMRSTSVKTPLVCNGKAQPFSAKYTVSGVRGTYYKEDCPSPNIVAHWHVTFN